MSQTLPGGLVQFQSLCLYTGIVALPDFSGTRVMMMPLIIGEVESLPESLDHYRDCFSKLSGMALPKHRGQVGYLTIDEKIVEAGETHRRAGLHVDGVYEGQCGSWGGGGWGSVGNGMITVSSVEGCRAYNQSFNGEIGKDGECDKLADQCQVGRVVTFRAGSAYWVDGLCVHESLPMPEKTPRQFVRLSLPSTAPWFEGYTENPKGIKPTGPILPRRPYME